MVTKYSRKKNIKSKKRISRKINKTKRRVKTKRLVKNKRHIKTKRYVKSKRNNLYRNKKIGGGFLKDYDPKKIILTEKICKDNFKLTEDKTSANKCFDNYRLTIVDKMVSGIVGDKKSSILDKVLDILNEYILSSPIGMREFPNDKENFEVDVILHDTEDDFDESLKNSLKIYELSIDEIKANYSGQEIESVEFKEEDKDNGKTIYKIIVNVKDK
tara:strand:- start:637 stop:1281 length:645 start_codon:yes stop_codon:yes gene_type:complete